MDEDTLTVGDVNTMSLKIVHGFIKDGYTPVEAMFVTGVTLATMFKAQGFSMATALDKYIEIVKEVYAEHEETKQ